MGAKKTKGGGDSTVITRSKPSKDAGASFFNLLKWILAIALVVGGVVANAYFVSVPWALRATGGIVVSIVTLLLLYFTVQGASVWGFVKLARMELRKVVWPTRPEVLQTTLMVVVMVLVTALVLWGIDALFLWGVGWLVGQRG